MKNNQIFETKSGTPSQDVEECGNLVAHVFEQELAICIKNI
jgi:hypothetical protein